MCSEFPFQSTTKYEEVRYAECCTWVKLNSCSKVCANVQQCMICVTVLSVQSKSAEAQEQSSEATKALHPFRLPALHPVLKYWVSQCLPSSMILPKNSLSDCWIGGYSSLLFHPLQLVGLVQDGGQHRGQEVTLRQSRLKHWCAGLGCEMEVCLCFCSSTEVSCWVPSSLAGGPGRECHGVLSRLLLYDAALQSLWPY